jgi:acylphosphatase
MARRRYLVEGHVQGVGYRYFAVRLARDLGLTGWVRNLADGRVEALGQGGEAELERFETGLQRGPAGSSVTNVQVIEVVDELKVPPRFEII